MKTKIGIPRALLYYKFHTLWKVFFEELGLEVVVSPKTTRKMLDEGIKNTIDEVCLPVKVFTGHILSLKDKVDYIFVPRLASVEKGSFVCAKFLGIPDVIENNFPDIPSLITADIDANKRTLASSMCEAGAKFSRGYFQLRRAYKTAESAQRQRPVNLIRELPKDKLTVGLIAHSYNIEDSFSNLNIVKKLEGLGASVITPDMLPSGVIRKEAGVLSQEVYWTYSREMLGGASRLVKMGVDGLIFLTSFGCGPDSLIAELAIRRLKEKTAIMSIIFDEGTGEAGVMTRLETFADMLKRRKRH